MGNKGLDSAEPKRGGGIVLKGDEEGAIRCCGGAEGRQLDERDTREGDFEGGPYRRRRQHHIQVWRTVMVSRLYKPSCPSTKRTWDFANSNNSNRSNTTNTSSTNSFTQNPPTSPSPPQWPKPTTRRDGRCRSGRPRTTSSRCTRTTSTSSSPSRSWARTAR